MPSIMMGFISYIYKFIYNFSMGSGLERGRIPSLEKLSIGNGDCIIDRIPVMQKCPPWLNILLGMAWDASVIFVNEN